MNALAGKKNTHLGLQEFIVHNDMITTYYFIIVSYCEIQLMTNKICQLHNSLVHFKVEHY